MREESGKGVTSHKSGGAWTEFCDTLQMRCERLCFENCAQNCAKEAPADVTGLPSFPLFT